MPIDTSKKPNDIKKQLQNDQILNPIQDKVLKTILKIKGDQVEEAIATGVPEESILDDSGIKFGNMDGVIKKPKPQPTQIKQQEVSLQDQLSQLLAGAEANKILQPQNVFTKQQLTPTGDLQLGGFLDFFGQSLDQIAKAQSITGNAPTANFKLQQEERRLRQEQRRNRQEKAKNIGDFGGTFNSQEIEELRAEGNIDLNATIEAFGITAKVDSKTGERTHTIPPQNILNEIAGRKTVRPKEIEYFQDMFDASDTMQEVLDGLADIGVKDLRQVGNFQFEEGLGSDLGPFSIPARFNLIGQFAKDSRFTALKVKLERAFQKYRKVITGAQASDRELKMLRPLIASFQQRPEVFFDTANDLIREGNRSVETRLNLMEDIGRDTKKVRNRFNKRKNIIASASSAAAGLSDVQTPQGPVGPINLDNIFEGL